KRENTIICYFWVGVSVVELGNVKEKKNISKNGAIIYDITIMDYKELLKVWDYLLKDLIYNLYSLGYEDLYIALGMEQTGLTQKTEEKGFNLVEKTFLKCYFCRCYKRIMKC
ncbi:MAG TPA: hypothetical protein GXZ78_00200, partial [Eubacteriaceae bacterium]|nr:hypothetical protein [Eubacteriaceae bacterium]